MDRRNVARGGGRIGRAAERSSGAFSTDIRFSGVDGIAASSRTLRQALGGQAMGNADDRGGRTRSRGVRGSGRSTGGGLARLRQEGSKDAAKRAGHGPKAGRKSGPRLVSARDLHRRWLKDPEYRDAYDALAPEFEAAAAVIRARANAGLSQEALARKAGTSQAAIARLEGGHVAPNLRTLERIAVATGTRLRFEFVPG